MKMSCYQILSNAVGMFANLLIIRVVSNMFNKIDLLQGFHAISGRLIKV